MRRRLWSWDPHPRFRLTLRLVDGCVFGIVADNQPSWYRGIRVYAGFLSLQLHYLKIYGSWDLRVNEWKVENE